MCSPAELNTNFAQEASQVVPKGEIQRSSLRTAQISVYASLISPAKHVCMMDRPSRAAAAAVAVNGDAAATVDSKQAAPKLTGVFGRFDVAALCTATP